jgi:hypothetical protein
VGIFLTLFAILDLYPSIFGWGTLIIATVALWVASMAVLQSRALKAYGTGSIGRVTSALMVTALLSLSQTAMGQITPAEQLSGNAASQVTYVAFHADVRQVADSFLQAVKTMSHAKAAPLLDSLIQ